MGVFALAAAVVALLAILDVAEGSEVLWWYGLFIALHLGSGWAVPLVLPVRLRGRNDG
jgi:hypothetical protein